MEDATLVKGGGAPEAPPVYKEYPRRWLILVVFCLSSMLSAIMWISFASVDTLFEARFNCSPVALNTFSVIYMALYPIGTVLASYLCVRSGLRTCLLIGAVGNAVCGVVRWVALAYIDDPGTSYAVAMIGQTAASLVQPLILNLPTRIANDWFKPSSRAFLTAVMTMANGLGAAGGSSLPAFFVFDTSGLAPLMLVQAVPCLAVLGLAIVVLRDEPPTPPSPAAAEQRRLAAAAGKPSPKAAFVTLWADTRALLRNKNYVLQMCAFSIGLGMSWALLTVMPQLIQPCNYGATVSATASAVFQLVGIVAALGLGHYITRLGHYVRIQQILFLAAIGALIMVLVTNVPGHGWLIVLSYAFLGIVLLPLVPVTLENMAECTFPITADTSAALVFVIANVVSLALAYALTPLLQQPVSANCSSVVTPSAGILLGFMVVAALCTLPLKPDYRRQKQEELALRGGAAGGADGEPTAAPGEAGAAKPASAAPAKKSWWSSRRRSSLTGPLLP